MADKSNDIEIDPTAPEAQVELDETALEDVAGGGYGTSTRVEHNDAGIPNARM
ncbi:hypothetical protein [Lentzea tibetensis]|uniref:hypothetical protein n=1 Tax=Lentzea tibetensis TaxID=2591470 RepID=UPI001644A36C|nr:hypothetical protein [Lentzea tibetensis]